MLKKLKPRLETATYLINRYVNEKRGATMGFLEAFECKVCGKESFNGDNVGHLFCVICNISHREIPYGDEWIDHLKKQGLIKSAENYKRVLELRKEWDDALLNSKSVVS